MTTPMTDAVAHLPQPTEAAILLPVGPGEREVKRVSDLIDSLFTYEPLTRWVVLIDDCVTPRHLERAFRCPPSCCLMSLPNPRMGRGCGYSGGLATGVLAGLAWIEKNTHVDFVLKLDTDTLVIANFATKIKKRLEELPQVGILGSHKTNPNGEIRHTAGWTPSLKTFLSPVKLRGKYLQITLWGRPRRVKEALKSALRNDYQWSEHCQGGAYAVSREMLKRMASRGYLDDPLTWLRAGCGEDVMMGVYAYAVGLTLSDFNRVGEPFGVQFIGLPDHPEALLARGFSLIHSVKDDQCRKEEEVRSFFRKTRGTLGRLM